MAEDPYQGRGATDPDERVGRELPEPPHARTHGDELAIRPVVSLRPIATPLPLGFLGLAMATVSVAALNLGWIDPAQGHEIALALLLFVAPLQLVACIGGFAGRDVVAATGMGVLAGTWATAGLVMLDAAPGSTSQGLAIIFFVAAAAMLLPASGATFGKWVPAIVMFGASLRFATSGFYQWTGARGWDRVTGWIGVILGAIAMYSALALLLEGATSRTVLPLGRRDRGQAAVVGDHGAGGHSCQGTGRSPAALTPTGQRSSVGVNAQDVAAGSGGRSALNLAALGRMGIDVSIGRPADTAPTWTMSSTKSMRSALFLARFFTGDSDETHSAVG